MRKMMIIGGLLVGLSGTTVAQKLSVEADQRYLLLAAERTATVQQEIDQAAALGFRILAGSPTSGSEMVLFLERVAQPPDTYTYRIVATTSTGTFQKELAAAAQEGFRLLPSTIVAKTSSAGRFLNGGRLATEVVGVLERAPKSNTRYEYRLLATNRTATLQKEVSDAATVGFALIGMVSRDEHMVIMEKETPSPQ